MLRSKEIARELLELEERSQTGNLSPKDSQLWQERAAQLFDKSGEPHHRKTTRLPVRRECVLAVGKGTFPCVLTEVSLVGLTVAGGVFGYIDKTAPISLRSVKVNGTQVHLNVSCELASTRHGDANWVGGLKIATGTGSMNEFFDKVYYPLYLQYLRDIVRGTHSEGTKATGPVAKTAGAKGAKIGKSKGSAAVSKAAAIKVKKPLPKPPAGKKLPPKGASAAKKTTATKAAKKAAPKQVAKTTKKRRG